MKSGFISCLFTLNKQKKIFRWPGRAHDARVFNRSPLCKDLPDLCYILGQRLDQTYHILGDSAYPLSNYVMTPYKHRRTELNAFERKYNTHHASKRSVIEHAFGLLGIRFPRLQHLGYNDNDKRILVVVAACVLHNWCIMEDDEDDRIFKLADHVELETDVNDYFPAALILGTRRANAGGNTKRDLLRDIIRDI